MASKRAIRRKSCEAKKRHATLAFALIAVAKTRGGVRAYRCPFGAHYHVGHESRVLRERREAYVEMRIRA
jgi:hypothetical protein